MMTQQATVDGKYLSTYYTVWYGTYIAKPVPHQVVLDTSRHHATLQVPRIPLTHTT